MSEPYSLFARIQIEENSFKEFLNKKPISAKWDADWEAWWKLHKKTDGMDQKDIDLQNFCCGSNAEMIETLLKIKHNLAFSDYDQQNGTWYFGIIMFTDKCHEMISVLSLLKNVSRFKIHNQIDFALVYSYFWNDPGVCAYLSYKDDRAYFESAAINKSDLDPHCLKAAEEYLDRKWKKFAYDDIAELRQMEKYALAESLEKWR